MLFNKSLSGITAVTFLLFLCSCTSKKNLVYFQGPTEVNSEITKSYSPLLQKDDLLSITVMGLDPKAAEPFNLPLTPVVTNNVGGYSQGAPTPPGSLIDEDGNIDFPVLGKVKLGGITRSAAVELMKERLAEYITKPSVNMRILNYKVTVLGEVRNPGTFTIPNERISLPEALGIAGDLLITGVRNNVLVIRDVNGVKTETRIDMTTKELFKSPVYYLQQNDIVYVQPNRAKINSSVLNPANVGMAISILSLVITMATLLRTQ
jgi:polysaccharide export outer membrane protein